MAKCSMKAIGNFPYPFLFLDAKLAKEIKSRIFRLPLKLLLKKECLISM